MLINEVFKHYNQTSYDLLILTSLLTFSRFFPLAITYKGHAEYLSKAIFLNFDKIGRLKYLLKHPSNSSPDGSTV